MSQKTSRNQKIKTAQLMSENFGVTGWFIRSALLDFLDFSKSNNAYTGTKDLEESGKSKTGHLMSESFGLMSSFRLLDFSRFEQCMLVRKQTSTNAKHQKIRKLHTPCLNALV